MATKSKPVQERHWKNRIVAEGAEHPEQLLANPLNWRSHPLFQQDAMRAALDELGWIQRVVVNQTTGHVIDGHLRVALAITKGEAAVPVSYVRLSPDEERLALATFDPLGSLAVADQDLLKGLLAEVQPYVSDEHLSRLLVELSQGQLLDLGGQVDLDALLEEEKAPTPDLSQGQGQHLDDTGREVTDQAPDQLKELTLRWGVEAGQTWRIPSGTVTGGEHLLHVGDALASPELERLWERCPPGTVVVTSPPYGMGQSYEAGYQDTDPDHARTPSNRRRDPLRKLEKRGPDQAGGHPTEQGVDEWIALIAGFCDAWAPHVAGAAVNLADHTVSPTPGYGMHSYGLLVSAAAEAGWRYVATRLWLKGGAPGLGNNPYWLNSYKPIPDFEYVGFFQAPGRFPFRKVSERVPASEEWRWRARWEFGSVASQQLEKGFHPAAFPVELPRRCILLFSDPGGTVADPFLGSGTTMVAAERLGRLCVGVELSPTFAAMALERMSRLGLSPRSAE